MRWFRIKMKNLASLGDVVQDVDTVANRRLRAGFWADQIHSGLIDGDPAIAVEVDMSGQAFHRLLKQRNLI